VRQAVRADDRAGASLRNAAKAFAASDLARATANSDSGDADVRNVSVMVGDGALP
jgi:hypothetical protein